MADLIAEKALEILGAMTDEEKKKIIRHDQCIRTAKILCIVASEARKGDILFNQFASEAVSKEITTTRRIKNKRGI